MFQKPGLVLAWWATWLICKLYPTYVPNIWRIPWIYVFIKFSTSDNAILAFLLVHWISVTSHYTCVWPYMEMNAVNVSRHKLFRGKPSFVEKNMDEKKQIRWAIYRRKTGNYGQCRPSNNKKATKFEIRLFNGTYTLSFLEKLQN